MHPNLLNPRRLRSGPSALEPLEHSFSLRNPPPLFSLRRKNHKGTRFARGRKSKLNHGDTESTEKCKKKARFRLVVFKLRVLCVSVVKTWPEEAS